jgi:hypothetical protein
MATRPPAGPIGNSPRDVRDDAVGVPADDVNAPAPPRWPPKPKKVTTNTFHAKVSGGASAKRADRKPHFRRGGFVSGFASGGSVEKKRDELPGEQKNDPFAKQNLKSGGVAKRQGGGDVPTPKPDPRYNIGDAPDLEPGVAKKWNEQMGRVRSIVRGDKQPWEKNTPPGRKKGGKT